jgi:hypothetical protein
MYSALINTDIINDLKPNVCHGDMGAGLLNRSRDHLLAQTYEELRSYSSSQGLEECNDPAQVLVFVSSRNQV